LKDPIVGTDILKQHCLMEDPANCRLVNKQGMFFATIVLSSSPTASIGGFTPAILLTTTRVLSAFTFSSYKLSVSPSVSATSAAAGDRQR
jgi:hypothetical protein